jgi:transposase-like protein
MKQRKLKRSQTQASVIGSDMALQPSVLIRQALAEQVQQAMLGLVANLFEQEVTALCGPRYERKTDRHYRRGGSEEGSIYWDGKRQAVRRPRAHDPQGEVSLESYQSLKDYDLFNQDVQRLLLRGISMRDYSAVTKKLDDDLTLSKSSASRAFVQASQKDLEAINGRDLADTTYGAIMIDGIERAGVHVVVALGFSAKGHKRVLGLAEGASENHRVVTDLIESLVERHLTTSESVLFVLDGARALHKAVTAHWGDRAVIQRCQEHKIRNVRDALPGEWQDEAERRLRAAYAMTTESQARTALQKLLAWLRSRNDAAARSLQEGLEETLAVHRLGLPEKLRKTFRSTNPIESLLDKVSYRGRRVKRWRTGRQVCRWAASSLLLHEQTFRRVRGHQQMHVLMRALENMNVDKTKDVA